MVICELISKLTDGCYSPRLKICSPKLAFIFPNIFLRIFNDKPRWTIWRELFHPIVIIDHHSVTVPSVIRVMIIPVMILFRFAIYAQWLDWEILNLKGPLVKRAVCMITAHQRECLTPQLDTPTHYIILHLTLIRSLSAAGLIFCCSSLCSLFCWILCSLRYSSAFAGLPQFPCR